MKIKIKKYASISIALLLSSLFLASCGSSDKHSAMGDLYLADINVDISDEKELLPPKNTSGEKTEFYILTETDTSGGIVASGETSEILDKKTFERNAKIADEYGIILSEINTDNIAVKVKNDILSGKCDYGMLDINASVAPLMIENGSLAELSELGFDHSGDGYYKKLIDSLALGDNMYLAAGNATPSVLSATSVVLLNTELCTSSTIGGYDQILSDVMTGMFTYETMYKYSSALAGIDTDSDVSDGAKYISISPDDAVSLFSAGSVPYYRFDSLLETFEAVSFGETTNEIYKAMQLLYGMSEDAEIYDGLDKKVGITPLFSISNLYELGLLMRENAPYIALPMPKMHEGQAGYTCLADADDFSCTAIPCTENAEYSLKVMNLIYASSDDVYTAMREPLAKSDMAIRIFDRIRDSVSGDVISMFGWCDTNSFMTSAINEHLRVSVFSVRASERIGAAVKALSIMYDSIRKK